MVLKKLKLAQLSKAELGRRELNRLVGGEKCCICGCPGPSGPVDNHNANTNYGYESYGGIPGTGGGSYA